MKKKDRAPFLAGMGRPNSLIPSKDGLAVCPCCGAVWKGGQPWAEKAFTPAELSPQLGMTPQNITSRIRKGTIAAYPQAGTGGRNKYLIPVVEVKRLMELPPEQGGPQFPDETKKDLGRSRG